MSLLRILSCFGLVGLTLMNPHLSMASEPSAALHTNTTGLKIYEALSAGEGNLCISPYSITAAMAMTFTGSSGVTREEMAKALGFPENPEALASAFAALNPSILPEPSETSTLRIANRLFGQDGFEFRGPFLKTLKEDFAAPLEVLDFESDPTASRQRINGWVEENTENKIQDLIPDGGIDQDTTLVLVNALYFLAGWEEPFPEGGTQQKPFRNADGESVDVPMMELTHSLFYEAREGYEVVALPYSGGEFRWVVLLPDESSSVAEVEKMLTPGLLAGLAALPTVRVNLEMPKFRLEPPSIALRDVMIEIGMPTAFDEPEGSADFDAMAPRRPDDYLYISNVFHKTFLDLDEVGTEAAAATAVVMMRATSMIEEPEVPIEVKVNRPFLFVLQHVKSGTALFLGRISDLL